MLEPDSSVYRELVLIKIRVDAENRQAVINDANVFRAKIVDVVSDSLIVELTGDKKKIDAFMKLIVDDGYEILELAKTGITGLSRGIDNVTFLD